jgi:hypothetical protein
MAKKQSANTSTNLDKLRQVFSESKGAGSGNINWWSPNWGDNVIRVLPPINEDDVFFFETGRHRINGEWFYCPSYQTDPETGRAKKCPICETRKRLYRSGDEDLISIAKELKVRKQYMMNIIDRKADDPETVRVYRAGVKLWNKMVTTMLDDDIDITDVEEGYDFLVKKEEGPRTENGTFPSYDNSKARRKPSPLHEDPKVVKEILSNRYELKDIPTFDDPETLQSAVDAYIKSVTQPPTASEENFYSDDDDESESKKDSSSSSKKDISDFKNKLKQQLDSDDDDEE